ncbi:MFS transporter [soil metagenome]
MFVNLTPLYKYRDFRLLFIGQFISVFGSMLVYVALPYQIYHLTHSSLAVGAIGVVELIPLLISSLYGGALADRIDRKKLLLATEFGLALTSSAFLINSLLPQPHIWLIFIIAAVTSALNGLHRPALESVAPLLLPHDALPAAAALNNIKYGINMIGGPAITGFLIAHLGLPTVYFIDGLTFLFSLIAIFYIRTPLRVATTSEPILRSIKQGFYYAMSRQELIGSYVVDIVAMIFGMPMALFPAIAEKLGGVTVLGWLYAAPAIGSLLASCYSGWVDKVPRHGLAIAIAATVWGFAIIGFGFAHSIYFAVIFLAIAGCADAYSGIFRMTLWNQTIPAHFRGRLAGIEMISYMSGPLLGNAEAGLVAAAFGLTFSVVSGGVLCVVGVGVCTLLLPKFWQYKKTVVSAEANTQLS